MAWFDGVCISVIKKITITTATTFVMASAVVGFFAGTADTVQYFRYSSGFPEESFTMNLLAGIAAFLMFASSVAAIVFIFKKRRRGLSGLVAVSSVMAFVLAFLPRAPIGSAVRPDLFTYLGGLGTLSLFFLYLSAPPPDTPDNAPRHQRKFI